MDGDGRRDRTRHGAGAGPLPGGPRTTLGAHETSFLAANPEHSTTYVTELVDLDAHIVIDLVEGNRAADLRRWCKTQDKEFLEGITTVATDLAESFRAGLRPHLDHARRVADPFHVVRAGNRCLDKVRRRVQQEMLGHRGRKDDPLYRIRNLLLVGFERLEALRRRARAGWRGGAGNGPLDVEVGGEPALRGPHRGGPGRDDGRRTLRARPGGADGRRRSLRRALLRRRPRHRRRRHQASPRRRRGATENATVVTDLLVGLRGSEASTSPARCWSCSTGPRPSPRR